MNQKLKPSPGERLAVYVCPEVADQGLEDVWFRWRCAERVCLLPSVFTNLATWT